MAWCSGLMFLWIARSVLTLLTGLAVFLALLFLLAFAGVKGLVNSAIYTDTLVEVNAYERVYSELLPPDTIEGFLKTIAGESVNSPSEELHELVKTIAPPEYLRSQVEANLGRLEVFASGDSDKLELYLELDGPLDRITPATLSPLERRIEKAPLEPGGQTRSQVFVSAEHQYADEFNSALEAVLSGEPISTAVSDLTGLTESEVMETFERFLDVTMENPAFDQKYRDSLREAEPHLRQSFASGNTRDLLRQAASTLAEPAIETALADFRAKLDDEGRLDLEPILAEELLGIGEEELQERARLWRQRVLSYLNVSINIALGALVLSAAIMLLVFWEKLGSYLTWLYWTLVLSGAAALALLVLAYFIVPGAIEGLLLGLIDSENSASTGLVALGSEVIATAVSNQIKALIWIPATPLVVGAVLWTVSPALGKLRKGSEPESETQPPQQEDDYDNTLPRN